MKLRIITSILILLSILFLPYWIYVPALVLGAIFFPLYIEAMLMGFLVDILYGAESFYPISFLYPFALGIMVLLLVLLPLRSQFRTYA